MVRRVRIVAEDAGAVDADIGGLVIGRDGDLVRQLLDLDRSHLSVRARLVQAHLAADLIHGHETACAGRIVEVHAAGAGGAELHVSPLFCRALEQRGHEFRRLQAEEQRLRATARG